MTDLQVIDATSPVELGVADEVIADLKSRLAPLNAGTHAGYELVKAGIAEVTRLRTGVEAARQRLVGPHVSFQKKTNAEAKRVREMLLEIETPLRDEKLRVDTEAERLRKENEEIERLAIEAKELAEKEAREAEEEAKREVERKEREAADAKLAEGRKALEADRERHETEQRWQLEQFEKERQDLAAEREKIEADRLAIIEKARVARYAREAVEQEEAEAVEAAAQKVRDEEERAKAAETVEEDVVERERIAEEQLPDREKLKDFARRIEAVKMPRLGTAWGNGKYAEMCEHLQRVSDVAYQLPSDGQLTEDDLAAAYAARNR